MTKSIISIKVKPEYISIKFVTCECPFGYCGETIRSTAFAVKSLVNGKREVDVITLNSFNAKFAQIYNATTLTNYMPITQN